MIDLPKFRRFMRCPKCCYLGAMNNQYRDDWPVSSSGERILEYDVIGNLYTVEAIKRTCPDCGYNEYQRPADYEEE